MAQLRVAPELAILSKAPVRQDKTVEIDYWAMHLVCWASSNYMRTVLVDKSLGKFVPWIVIESPPNKLKLFVGAALSIVH
jgi:hypothetical protein